MPRRNGALSLSDVERAVAGLAETAAVERWDGRNWQPSAEVTLQPLDVNPLERTAEIPPLAEGDYRLVRVGPDGAHTGRFWVTDAAS